MESLTKDERNGILFALDVARKAIEATTVADEDLVFGNLPPELRPTPFVPPGHLDSSKLANFSYTTEQVDAVIAEVEEKIRTENRNELWTQRAIQIMDTVKPLIKLAMGVVL